MKESAQKQKQEQDKKYHCICRAAPSLSADEKETMAQIYFDHYDACDAARFYSDLAEKSDALLLYHNDRIVGFTTYLAYGFVWQSEPLRVVFSGDTVVTRAHWGQQTLAFAWVAQMGRLYRAAPEPLYWFLIVKGHRTYRYLPLFGGEFFPHWRTLHPELQALANALAQARFGADYDPESGLVHFAHSHGHLKAQFAYPDDRAAQRESVAFFLRRNPNFWQGDELVCLYQIKPENMSPFWRRIFLSGAA